MNTTENNTSEVTETDTARLAPVPSGPSSRWLLVGLSAAAIGLGIAIYSGIHERAQAESTLGVRTERAAVPTVTVVQPTSGAATQEIVLPGDTQAFNNTPIYARTNGYLKRWYVDIGTHVQQGQLLAEIDTPEIDQQLEQARADLKNAQANEQLAQITAARWQSLLKTNSVSKQETDQAVTDLSARQASVDSMTANVHRLEQLQSFEKVYAPFAGVITARNTDIGALINAGAGGVPQELFHMAAVNKLRVYVAVPEVDSLAAQNGATATLTLDEFPGEIFQGTIVRNSKARLVRDGSVVADNLTITTLRRFKDDANEVRAGFECGVGVSNFSDVKVGDILECFKIEKTAAPELMNVADRARAQESAEARRN